MNINDIPPGTAAIVASGATRPDQFHTYEEWEQNIAAMKAAVGKPKVPKTVADLDHAKIWARRNAIGGVIAKMVLKRDGE